MNIGIIGVGYVGLVSGACFTDLGHFVTCFDVDKKKISNLKRGIIPIYEPGLTSLVNRNIIERRLRFEDSIEDRIKDFDILFITVGTPEGRDNKSVDLQNFYEVGKTIRDLVEPEQVIVIKSTVPVGTNRKFSDFINKGKDQKKCRCFES